MAKKQADNASKHVILLVLRTLQFTVQNLCQTTPAFSEKPGSGVPCRKTVPKTWLSDFYACQLSNTTLCLGHILDLYITNGYITKCLQFMGRGGKFQVYVCVYSVLVTLSGHFNDKYFMGPDTLYFYNLPKCTPPPPHATLWVAQPLEGRPTVLCVQDR